MTKPLPKAALTSQSPSQTPPGSIQFFDGYFPALFAGTYDINIKQTISATGAPPAFTLPQQSFTVQAPEFFIDTTIVQHIYPPQGSSGQYHQNLSFLVMSDPSLPWERSLVPDGDAPGSTDPTAWMALLIFAENEMVFPSNSSNPITTVKVSELLAADPNVFKPQLPNGWVSTDVLASTCQTITIPGAAFNAVVPSKDDLQYMTHCRGVNTLDEGEQLLSVLLCNRLAVANTTVTPAKPTRYHAHLLSLEGYGDYLPGGTTIPSKASGGLKDVQLVSLYNWSFVSLPETGQSFETLVTGLISSEKATQHEEATHGTLSLPIPVGSNLPSNVKDRLTDGYAPLTFVSGAGDESFAWYRGPFSAVVPQPLPEVGDPSVPVTQAESADGLMIYLAEQGLFDLSYAAAWNIGRNLALADVSFTQNVVKYRQTANRSLSILAQRMSMPHFSRGTLGEINAQDLLASNASRRKFANRVGAGMGQQLTTALAGVREAAAPTPEKVHRGKRSRVRSVLHPRDVLSQPGVADAMTENMGEITDKVTDWLAALSLLKPLPFSYLVPDPKMLPVESIRFFYVDPGWTEALIAGAMSIAMHSTQDVAVDKALLPSFISSGGGDMSGMLIRSQLIPGWPKLVVSATVGGAPLNIVRNDCVSANVRLVLFDGIPDTVTLAEPYQGLQFGVEDDGIYPRCVTSYALTGAIIANASRVQPVLRTPTTGNIGGVVEVKTLATALERGVGIVPFASDGVVNWKGTALATTFVNGNQLTAIVPADLTTTAGAAAVTVSNGSITSLPVNFTINAPLEIDSINPTIMQVGADKFELTVVGTGFATGATVNWNGAALTTKIVSAAEVTAEVPPDLVTAISTATITVTCSHPVLNSTSNSVTLKVVGGDPVIDTLQPNVAMAGGTGFTLTVMGSGFTSKAIVEWNGTPLATTFVSEQHLTAMVKKSLIASAASVAVTVMVDGTASSAATFTIAGQQLVIGSLQPSVAMVGGTEFTLIVDGVNFDTDAKIQWNGTALTTIVDDTKQLTATVPASSLVSAGEVSVTVLSNSVTSNAINFTVIAVQPAIGLLEPASVVAGGGQFTLTVTGGFGAGDFALQMVAAPELQSFEQNN